MECDLRHVPFSRFGSYAAFPIRSAFSVNAVSARRFYTPPPLRGTLDIDAPFGVARNAGVVSDFAPGADGVAERLIEEFLPVWNPAAQAESFDAAVQAEWDT